MSIEFQGKDLTGLADIIAHAESAWPREVSGIKSVSLTPERQHALPNALAGEMLGDEKVFEGLIGQVLGDICGRAGFQLGKNTSDTFNRDYEWKAAISVHALSVAAVAGVFEDVAHSYETGFTNGYIEGRFVFGYKPDSSKVRQLIDATVGNRSTDGVSIARVIEDSVFHKAKQKISLQQVARGIHDAYDNLALSDEGKREVSAVVRKIFATKNGLRVDYDATLGMGTPEEMLLHWDSEHADRVLQPLDKPVTRQMAQVKILSAVARSGYYGEVTPEELLQRDVGHYVQRSMDLLKSLSQKTDALYSPVKIYRRLVSEIKFRIGLGVEDHIKLAEALTYSLEAIFGKKELAFIESRLDSSEATRAKLLETLVEIRHQSPLVRVTTGDNADGKTTWNYVEDKPGRQLQSGERLTVLGKRDDMLQIGPNDWVWEGLIDQRSVIKIGQTMIIVEQANGQKSWNFDKDAPLRDLEPGREVIVRAARADMIQVGAHEWVWEGFLKLKELN